MSPSGEVGNVGAALRPFALRCLRKAGAPGIVGDRAASLWAYERNAGRVVVNVVVPVIGRTVDLRATYK